jgi:hypothetical protein
VSAANLQPWCGGARLAGIFSATAEALAALDLRIGRLSCQNSVCSTVDRSRPFSGVHPGAATPGNRAAKSFIGGGARAATAANRNREADIGQKFKSALESQQQIGDGHSDWVAATDAAKGRLFQLGK